MSRMDRRSFLKTTACFCPLLVWGRGRGQEKKRLAVISADDCIGCEACLDACPVEALSMDEKNDVAVVDKVKCDACGECVDVCPVEAIQIKDAEVKDKPPADAPPKKKDTLPRLEAEPEGTGSFDIIGVWTITVKFPDDDEPSTGLVKFSGTPVRGTISDALSGDKQGTYVVKDGRVEFKLGEEDTAQGKFTARDKMEGTLSTGGTWVAIRKRS